MPNQLPSFPQKEPGSLIRASEINALVNVIRANAEDTNLRLAGGETLADIAEAVRSIMSTSTGALLATEASVYADGTPGQADPTGQAAGWYYKNTNDLTDKINWYYLYNANVGNIMTVDTMDSMYAVVRVVNGSIPYMVYYTTPEGDGNDAAAWYRSRFVYSNLGDMSVYEGQDILIYWGTDPTLVSPGLPRVELTLDGVSTVGPQGVNENVMFGALSTSTGHPAGHYEFVVEKVGVVNDSDNQVWTLLNQAPGEPVSNGYANTHYVALDATNDYIEMTTSAIEIDFYKSWTIAMTVESVSSVNDSSYTTLFRSGGNVVTLRKGGTNWGIYVATPTGNVWQANTWHAPVAGSKIVIRCDHNAGTLNYYLHNAHDGGSYTAGGTMNATYRAGNDPQANRIDVGRGGAALSGGYFPAGYWFGGLNDVVVWDQYISQEMLTEYLSSDNVTEHSYYDADVEDVLTLGEGTYPDCSGLKGNISATLMNGTPEDFVQR